VQYIIALPWRFVKIEIDPACYRLRVLNAVAIEGAETGTADFAAIQICSVIGQGETTRAIPINEGAEPLGLNHCEPMPILAI
jgi:hypothetical protein